MNEKKNLEVVSGDGSNLNISPVYDHLNVSTPKTTKEKPKYVVVPKESNNKKEKLSKSKTKNENKDEDKK